MISSTPWMQPSSPMRPCSALKKRPARAAGGAQIDQRAQVALHVDLATS
jgi:hypothetical protein